RIFLKKMIKVSLLCGLIFLNVSCARILQTTNTPDLKSGEYSMEIMRLKDVIKNNPSQSERIKAHYQLANLYASYKNSEKDYKKALEHLNIYISLDSKAIKQNDLRNCLSLLREVDRLSGELSILNRKNLKLTQTIEKLQTLDLLVEQKRKSYR
ncbi:MAG: hypothetical protein ABUJ92_02200, partial [Desulfobacterales bacterium]